MHTHPNARLTPLGRERLRLDTFTIGVRSRSSQRRQASACERPTSGWLATAQAVLLLCWIDVVFAALSG